ncbi:MAG: hypothetical protein HUU50_02975 [Candidatus Brocadiae bacterium]|nr:hypothetical protein [Candidatus Brocadiia bacterium]
MVQKNLLLVALLGNLVFCFFLPWCVSPEVPTKLREENIVDLDSFLKKLLSEKIPLSPYLYSRLSKETQEMVQAKTKNKAMLISFLLEDLNKILDEEEFFDSQRFENFKDLPEVQKFLDNGLEGEERKIFHSFLLMKVYPGCFLPIKNYWIHKPTLEHFLFFGTYKQENLVYLVGSSAGIALSIGFFSLLVSILLGIFVIFLEFHPSTAPWILPIEKGLMYFPRLFLLILFCSFFKLQETSQLSWDIRYYLIAGIGVTGAFFLSSQTLEEISELKEKLFVSFAYSLGYSSFLVFIKHILHNCSSLPISIVKQMRDNILFLSILTFIGVVHLQPEDLGSLIFKLYNTPETFFQGWWILFFPCAFLTWLIFFFDLLGEELKKRMQKRKISIIK